MATRNTPKASAKNGSTNGILQVNGSQTNRVKQAPKPAARLKVNVRRLPPGLLEVEFISIIGAEWEVKKGKVDYFRYKEGKESKDGSKQSRPSLAIFHVKTEQDVRGLDETIRSKTFEDAANTWNSSCLVGPPTVEFATFQRIPTGRIRQDARQGTIDQDPEFMEFLDSLVNPNTTKEETEEGVVSVPMVKGAKVTVTPLVQFLKDKKLKRTEKADASRSAAKASAASEVKTIIKANKTDVTQKRGATETTKKDKSTERVAKDAPKIMNRATPAKSNSDKPTSDALIEPQASSEKSRAGRRQRGTPASTVTSEAAASSAKPYSDKSSPDASVENSLPAEKGRAARRIRASAATAASILQRDLGLSDFNSTRRIRADATKANTIASPATQDRQSTTPGSSRAKSHGNANVNKDTATTSAPTPSPTTIPTLLKKATLAAPTSSPQAVPQSSTSTPKQPTPPTVPIINPRRQPQNPTPSNSTATRAFVKHANPSQGVTELLLKAALEEYGKISYVEIDKKKGFAYADFADNEGLKQAMKGSPIKVGNGTVVVLERKDRGDSKTTLNATHSTPVVSRGQAIPQVQAQNSGAGNHGIIGTPPYNAPRNTNMGTIGRRGGRGQRGPGRGQTIIGQAVESSATATPPVNAPTGPAANKT